MDAAIRRPHPGNKPSASPGSCCRNRHLLFLGDVAEPGFAKTAFGLRDWAGDRCVGEYALPGARVSLGLPKSRPQGSGGSRRTQHGDRRCQRRRPHTAELVWGAARSPGSRTGSRIRHAHAAVEPAGLAVGGRQIQPPTDRCANTADRYSDRVRFEAFRTPASDRRHRLCSRQEIHRPRHRARPPGTAESMRRFALPVKPGS